MDKKYDFKEVVDIIAALRSENGCPWDREQTHESLKKCMTEECGEVLEAIDNQDDENLCEELGDVLLQVLMHSQIAAEEGRFSIADVVDGLGRKMVRRHPHVFGDAKAVTEEEALKSWKEIKKLEKVGKIP